MLPWFRSPLSPAKSANSLYTEKIFIIPRKGASLMGYRLPTPKSQMLSAFKQEKPHLNMASILEALSHSSRLGNYWMVLFTQLEWLVQRYGCTVEWLLHTSPSQRLQSLCLQFSFFALALKGQGLTSNICICVLIRKLQLLYILPL